MSVGPDERRLDSTARVERRSVVTAQWARTPFGRGRLRAAGRGHGACRADLPHLPFELRSCGLARNAVLSFCRAQGLTDLTEDAALLTSELVGNAVEHAGTPITLKAESRAGRLSVWVTDDNALRAIRGKAEPELLEERGRGLLVVEAIAAEWGTTPQGTGKSVWFRLP